MWCFNFAWIRRIFHFCAFPLCETRLIGLTFSLSCKCWNQANRQGKVGFILVWIVWKWMRIVNPLRELVLVVGVKKPSDDDSRLALARKSSRKSQKSTCAPRAATSPSPTEPTNHLPSAWPYLHHRSIFCNFLAYYILTSKNLWLRQISSSWTRLSSLPESVS